MLGVQNAGEWGSGAQSEDTAEGKRSPREVELRMQGKWRGDGRRRNTKCSLFPE